MIGRIVSAAALLLVGGAAAAEGHSIAGKAGLLGLGVEYGYGLNDRVTLRAGMNGSSFGFDREESGIDYEFDFDWDSVSVAVDFHPLKTAFRLTGGLLRNRNSMSLLSRPTEDVTIGSQTYTPEQVGTLTASVGFRSTAPFAGVGWDWSRGNRLLGVSFDLGVVQQGSPRASLNADGSLSDEPAFQNSLEAERAELQNGLRDFKLMPYGTLGLVFRF